MNRVTKHIVVFTMVFSLATAAVCVRPQRANAAVAGLVALVGGPATPFLVAAGISGGLGLLSFATMETENCGECWGNLVNLLWGVTFIGAGILLLDEHTPDLMFTDLNAKTAKAMKVSEKDLNVYRSELDELNAVRESIIENVRSFKPNSKEELASFITAQWDSAGKDGLLSPGTLRVAKKLSDQLTARFIAATQQK